MKQAIFWTTSNLYVNLYVLMGYWGSASDRVYLYGWKRSMIYGAWSGVVSALAALGVGLMWQWMVGPLVLGELRWVCCSLWPLQWCYALVPEQKKFENLSKEGEVPHSWGVVSRVVLFWKDSHELSSWRECWDCLLHTCFAWIRRDEILRCKPSWAKRDEFRRFDLFRALHGCSVCNWLQLTYRIRTLVLFFFCWKNLLTFFLSSDGFYGRTPSILQTQCWLRRCSSIAPFVSMSFQRIQHRRWACLDLWPCLEAGSRDMSIPLHSQWDVPIVELLVLPISCKKELLAQHCNMEFASDSSLRYYAFFFRCHWCNSKDFRDHWSWACSATSLDFMWMVVSNIFLKPLPGEMIQFD